MRETTSSAGAASSSGSLNGCTPSATPDTSSSSRCSSAFGTVGTKETPSTSSRASTSAQPARDIVVGSSNFFLLIPVVLVAISPSLSCWCAETLSCRGPRFYLGHASFSRGDQPGGASHADRIRDVAAAERKDPRVGRAPCRNPAGAQGHRRRKPHPRGPGDRQ